MLAGLSLDYSGRMRLCGCLGKARRGQPSPTAVGRYVDSHAGRPSKALAAILTKYAKRIAAKSAKRLGKVFDPDKRALLARLDQDITKALMKAEDDDLKALLAALEDEMKDMSAEMRLALATEMLAAFRRAGTVGVMQAGFPMTPEIVKQLDEKARAFAEERGGWLIKDLAGTTIENLRATLARGVEEGMSADDLSDAIQEAGAFGESRADMIARTELAFAHVQGNVEGWRITGEVELKRSILGDLHDIDDECDEAVDAGDIPLEDEFIDGYAFPPYHPYCICDVLPILREGQDGEG